MALITTHHTVYVRSYPWKVYYYIIITNFATAVAVSAVTWSTILRQFTKNYDLFQDTTPKCWHYASIAGKPIML